MGKAIVIKGANFSSSNLGKVTLIRTLEEKIQLYGDTIGATQIQKEALVLFAKNLQIGGVWGKLIGVFPMLGGVEFQSLNMVNMQDAGFRGRDFSYDSVKNCMHCIPKGNSLPTYGSIDIGAFNDFTLLSSHKAYDIVSSDTQITSIGRHTGGSAINIYTAKTAESTIWRHTVQGIVTIIPNAQFGLSGQTTSANGKEMISSISINGIAATGITFDTINGTSSIGNALDVSSLLSNIPANVDPKFAPVYLGGYFGAVSTTAPYSADYYNVVIAKSLSLTEHKLLVNEVNKLNVALGRYVSDKVLS